VDEEVFRVGAPTAIAFTPDGRMLVTTQPGALRVYQNGQLLSAPALQFPSTRICSNSERGLLGVAVDPEFDSNSFIYLYYTFRRPNGDCASRSANGPVNRVSRFVLSAANTVDSNSETVLLDNISSWNGNHNAGDLAFGKDGLLYITTGDAGCDPAGDSGCAGQNDASRDTHTLLGKVLRITRDGAIPPGNPWQGAGTARCNSGPAPPGTRCQETFAWGLRNPFRFAFDPNAAGVRLFILDVGQNVWEEINEGRAGADYGWNIREGPCANGSATNCGAAPPGLTDPLYAYRHDVQVPGTQSRNCNSISGGAFVPRGVWPAEYEGTFLFADYVCGSIFRLSLAGTPAASDFVRSLGVNSAVHLAFGPLGNTLALYYTTYAGGGSVRRIRVAGSNNAPPTAQLSATPLSGLLPLTVNFSAAGSRDPDPGDTLTYFWNFGDGSAERTTTEPATQYTYTRAGGWTATLRVRDSALNFSQPASVRVFAGNQAPVPAISGIPSGFRVGQRIRLTGSAVDPEDGVLPGSRLSWSVRLHHADHTHPFLGPLTGDSLEFAAPAPENLSAAGNSYLEVLLTATDSAGQPVTLSRDLRPLTVNLTFESSPTGLVLRVNSEAITTPATLVSWADWALSVAAPDQTAGGQRYLFRAWSDFAPRTRLLVTPATAATYRAVFDIASGNPDTFAIVSGASFLAGIPVAPVSIVTGYGAGLAAGVATAMPPLPDALTGVQVRVRDSAGTDQGAALYAVSPGQINFVIPAGTAPGRAVATVLRDGAVVASGSIEIDAVAPSLFTANADGRGVPAAYGERIRGSVRTRVDLFQCSAGAGSCVPLAVDFGPEGEEVFLSLFGTGIRGRSSLDAVRVTAGGLPLEVLYAGPQGQFPGLDQLNVRLPRALAARGEVELLLAVDGRAANPVRIAIR
jgi:uncharacterized protein (TIGR03437 family)